MQKIPPPSSYSLTVETAGAALAGTSAFTVGVERVMSALLVSSEDIAAASVSTPGTVKARPRGFSCFIGAGTAGWVARNTISLGTGGAGAIFFAGSDTAISGAAFSATASAMDNDTGPQLTPRICAQIFPPSSHRSISSFLALSPASLPGA